MTRDNFGQLLVHGHKKIFFDEYTSLPDQYTNVFDIGTDMQTKTETYQHEGGFGKWSENTEGNTINETQMHEGQTVTWIARRFDQGYSVTWEMVQDDLYNIMQKVSPIVTEGKGKGGSAKALAQGLKATIESDCADVLNNGFTANGYDSVPLFSNSHPLADSAALGDNLTTGALSDLALKAALTLLRQTVDEAGVKIMAVPDKLIVPAELEFTAKQILKSTNIAGELSNTANTLPDLKLVVMDYLTSSSAWFVKAKTLKNLEFRWRERPWFGAREIPKTVDWFYHGFTRFDNGYGNYRGIVGSAG